MKEPLDLARARILLTNDDGVEAPGLKLLHKLVRRMAADVWIVAPETEQSASGHSLTLRRPLRLRKLSARRYAVDGTPTDAVLLAVMELMKDRPPDLVLSGINRGGNMGEDVTYSGTVSAAMEATLLGVPAVALSQDVRPGGEPAWATSAAHLPDILARLAAARWPRNVFINVNVPAIPADAVSGVRVVSQGRRKPGGALAEGRDPRGLPYYWIATTRMNEHHLSDSDLEAVYHHNAVAVTPMHLDLTHRPTLKPLAEVFQ
jgi:5'-nucleotidase